ncbi:unnamed protein product, partial [Iphiclides podalirius]
MLGDFTYSKQSISSTGVRWKCSRQVSRKCNAYVVVDGHGRILKMNDKHMHEPFRFIRTSKKRLLAMLNGFTYFRHYALKSGVRWQCTKHYSQNCNSYLIVDTGGTILRLNENHTHAPSNYLCNKDVKFITTLGGRKLALFNGYTYFKHVKLATGVRWTCSSHSSKKCRGALILDEGGSVIRSNPLHTHEPSHYHCLRDGVYYKL